MYLSETQIQTISSIAKKHDVDRIYVFGSYARGEADIDSDIDLIVDTRDFMKMVQVELDIEKDLKIDVDTLQLKSLRKMKENRAKRVRRIAENADKEKILIYENE